MVSTPTPTVTPTPGVAPTPTAEPALVRSKTSFAITRDGATLTIPVYVSQPLSSPDVRVTRAVIAIHGISRNADGYWNYAAAGLKGVSGTLLIAPKFTTASDSPTETQLYWASSGWSRGNLSESGDRPWRISSYGVVDEMVARLRARFVNLRSVVIVGHSAGGQLTQRYASASDDPSLRFVVMNPGSYLYLSSERPDGAGGFAVPEPAPAAYDNYKYGLQNLGGTPYMAAIGASTLRSRYEAAHVRYLLGALDTDPDDPHLDVRAPAMLQGAHRLERGQLFFSYLGSTFGASVYERHVMTVVPGVGHSAKGMFGSAAARTTMTQ